MNKFDSVRQVGMLSPIKTPWITRDTVPMSPAFLRARLMSRFGLHPHSRVEKLIPVKFSWTGVAPEATILSYKVFGAGVGGELPRR